MSNEKSSSPKPFSLETFLAFALPNALSFLVGAIPENLRLEKQTSKAPITYWQAGKNILNNRGPVGFIYGVHYGLPKKAALAGTFGISLIPISQEIKPYLPQDLLKNNPDAPYMIAAFPAAAITTGIAKVFDNPRIYETTGPKGTNAWQELIKNNYNKEGARGVGNALFKGFAPSAAVRAYNVVGYHALFPHFNDFFKYAHENGYISDPNNKTGAATGCFLGVVSAPFARAITEMLKHGSVSKNFLNACEEILKKGGWRSFFTGGMVHTLHAGLSGVAYEKALDRVEGRSASARSV